MATQDGRRDDDVDARSQPRVDSGGDLVVGGRPLGLRRLLARPLHQRRRGGALRRELVVDALRGGPLLRDHRLIDWLEGRVVVSALGHLGLVFLHQVLFCALEMEHRLGLTIDPQELGHVLRLRGVPLEDDQRVAGGVRVTFQHRENILGAAWVDGLRQRRLRPVHQELLGNRRPWAALRRQQPRLMRRDRLRGAGYDGELRRRGFLDLLDADCLRKRRLDLQPLQPPDPREVRGDGSQQLHALVKVQRRTIRRSIDPAPLDVLLPPLFDGVLGAFDAIGPVDAEVLGKVLNLIDVHRAVLDDERIRAGPTHNALEQIRGDGERHHLAPLEHRVHGHAGLRVPLEFPLEQQVTIHRLRVGLERGQHACKRLRAAARRAQDKRERGHDMPSEEGPRRVDDLGEVPTADRGSEATGQAHEAGQLPGTWSKQVLHRAVVKLRDLRFDLSGVTPGADSELLGVRGREVQEHRPRHAGHAVLQELSLFSALREADQHHVLHAQRQTPQDLCKHEGANNRRVRGLASPGFRQGFP
mmetsp:Transcript_32684/g.90148  ORF Transcript_32684/g.90148 Transcript_32684/m.90148 type:complete len:529 (-) Transcript_32684:1978-3564(-)